MRGNYIIGVHSYNSQNYTIAAKISDVSISTLHKGIPMNYINDNVNNSTSTFSYVHDSKESFTITLKEEYGFAHLLVNSLDKD